MGQAVCCQDGKTGDGLVEVSQGKEPEVQTVKSMSALHEEEVVQQPGQPEPAPETPPAPPQPEPAPQEQPGWPEPVPEKLPAPPQPEPAPKEQPVRQEKAAPVVEEQQIGVTLDFDVNGQPRTVTALKKPLGLEFKMAAKPPTVASVKEGSHSAELGIQIGWKLIAIGSASSRETLSNQETIAAMNVFRRYVAQLPNLSGSVDLRFNANGEDKVVTVSRAPLGLNFERTAPITVYSVKEGTHAHKLGINVGWILKTVGDEDVSALSYEKAVEVFQRSMNALPRIED